MAHVVIVNGPALSGKDTFCQFCKDRSYANDMLAVTVSSVDRVKEAAKLLAWNGEKTEAARKFLSDLKDLSTQFADAPMLYLTEIYEQHKDEDDMILFMHIREPEEIERAKNTFDAITLLVKRPGFDPIQSNHADRDVDQYDYDYTVINNGTLDDLMNQAGDFVKKVKCGYFEKRREEAK